MKKEGFDKFSLDIYVMPHTGEKKTPSLATEFYSDYYFLFLEQYYLLHKDFYLNTQRIVNFRVNQGTNIYLYDLEGKTLYYSFKSLNQIKGNLGIHPDTCNNCIKEGKSYLNFFKIANTPIKGASVAKFNIPELASLISPSAF
jgi:hypothetical protein